MREGDIGGYNHRGGKEVQGGDISATVALGLCATVWMLPKLFWPTKASKVKGHMI